MKSNALITFGDGSLGWRNAARRLENQAASSGFFDQVFKFDLRTLAAIPPRVKGGVEFDRDLRGLGYWSWKPLIMNTILNQYGDNFQRYFYIDAGCTLNVSEASKKRFQDYCNFIDSSGGLAFQLPQNFSEEKWCKEDVLIALRATDNIRKSGQILGGIMGLNFQKGSSLIQKWTEHTQNLSLIDDSPSKAKNALSFIEHRHDQAIFSILAKQSDIAILPDETDFHPGRMGFTSEIDRSPIWATRHQSGMRSLSMNPALRAIRAFERLIP